MSQAAPTSAAEAAAAGPGLVVVYDGDCPFCKSYVRLTALRRQVGTVALVDARSADPVVLDLKRRGYDLNEGMAAIFGGTIYYGSDALALISAMTGTETAAGRIMGRVLRDPGRARRLYPWLKAGRKIALRVLGREEIKR